MSAEPSRSKVREEVRERYADAAQAVEAGQAACCGPGPVEVVFGPGYQRPGARIRGRPARAGLTEAGAFPDGSAPAFSAQKGAESARFCAENDRTLTAHPCQASL